VNAKCEKLMETGAVSGRVLLEESWGHIKLKTEGILDLNLTPCFECCMLSSGYFPGF